MNKLQTFVIWLDGYLDAVGEDMDLKKTNVIKDKLNNLFEHEAEKPTLQDLGKKHKFEVIEGLPESGGIFPSEDDVRYRC